jgi:hypothetical protein
MNEATPLESTRSPNGMHKCAAHEIVLAGKPACDRNVPHRLLMCPNHWRLVTGKNQRNLYLRYRSIDAEGRAQLSDAYLAAVKLCLLDVKARLEETPRVVPS